MAAYWLTGSNSSISDLVGRRAGVGDRTNASAAGAAGFDSGGGRYASGTSMTPRVPTSS